MKVLVVDDDNVVLEFLEVFFENLNHEVITVSDPNTGLKKLISEKPDLVLLDIMMPQKSGLDLLKEMKAADKDVSIAMITAVKDAEKVIEAYQSGAMDFLLKPFNLEYIINTVLPKVKLRQRQ